MGNSHAIWDHTVLPATRQRWESRLFPQPKQVLDLATAEGYKAELTYVTWKRTGRELNPRPVNRKSSALPLSHHVTRPNSVARSVLSGCRDDWLINSVQRSYHNKQQAQRITKSKKGWLVAWHSVRTSVFGWRTFSVLRSTCSWRVTTYVGEPSAIG